MALKGRAFPVGERAGVLLKHMYMKMSLKVSIAAGDGHVGATGVELHGGHVQGAERAGAGGIDDAVSAAEIEAVGDAPRGDVSEESGEGVFLPGDVGVGDSLDDVVGDSFVDAGVVRGLCARWGGRGERRAG